MPAPWVELKFSQMQKFNVDKIVWNHEFTN